MEEATVRLIRRSWAILAVFAYGTFQPNDFISEAISVIAAGVFYDPRPKAEFCLNPRRRLR
jgi:hypothetical protein